MIRKIPILPLIIQQWALFTVTLLLALWVDYLVTGLVASQQGIAVSYLPEYLLLVADQALWVDCSCTVGVYLSGPIVSLALGLLLLGFFPFYADAWPWFRLFFLLFGMQLAFRMLVGLGAGIAAGEGLWFSMAWMYWPKPLQIFVAGLGGAGIVLLGYLYRKRWYTALAYTEAYLYKKHSTRDTISLGWLPALLSVGVVMVFYGWNKNEWLQLGFYGLGWTLFFLPAIFAQRSLESDGFLLPDEEEEPPYRFRWAVTGIAIVGVAVLWWLL